MNTRQKGPLPPSDSITMRDIYYILFRRKWLILVLVTLGIVSAAAVNSYYHFPLFSEARICVLYIPGAPTVTDFDGHGATVVSPDHNGQNILNSQIQILTSSDLALQVASNIGPATILGKPSETNNLNGAEAYIHGHLLASVSNNCDVISLTFTSPNPALPQKVLTGIIAAYNTKYVETYNTPTLTDESLQEQADLAKGQFADAVRTLGDQKVKMHVTSVTDAAKNMADEIAKTEEAIFQTRSDLAESDAVIRDMEERVSGIKTNAQPSTNVAETVTPSAPVPPTPQVMAKYQSLNALLNSLSLNEQNLMGQFTTNTAIVKNAQQQRMAAETNIQQFLDQNPGLVSSKTASSPVTASGAPVFSSADPALALREAMTKKHTLQARFKELTNQLAIVQTNAVQLDSSEGIIMQAQTEMEVASNKYDHFLKATEQARINEAINSKVSGIKVVEQPTPPAYELKSMTKITGGVLFFFLALAFGLPVFIERVLDQSFKHPMEVQAEINAPFFITIPLTNGHGKIKALKRGTAAALLTANGSGTTGADSNDRAVLAPTNGQMPIWDQGQEIRPFLETLRDRLISYFEMINLTHKPKLVAVTSCAAGAGVTTTAAGLASSLSETGEGNVLLVNMNARDGEAHHFYKGKMDCGIEDALGRVKRDHAQVHDNLYVAQESGPGEGLPRVLPKRFSHLLPLMKASDYDYIIFDMPPVTEISITPRLARFMDMVLVVIESGKTPREAAARATSLLAESKTNVGLVLNKNRSYLPKRLEQSI